MSVSVCGNNQVTRHRYPFQHCTTTQSPTCTTPNHTFTTNEQACFPQKTFWRSPSPKNHTEEASLHIQRNFHKQLFDSLTDTLVERSVLFSQSTSHTGAHLMQPSSGAYEAEDRCIRVSVARILMMPHPAASSAADVVQSCPNKSAAGMICNKPVDLQQHHCYGCRYEGGVDRRHDVLLTSYTHTVAPRYSLNRKYLLSLVVNGQREHARMDLVFNLNGSVTFLDVSIVAHLSCNPSQLRKPNLTDTHASTSSISYSRPQADRGHTPENSSAILCEMLRTPRMPSGTHGQLSKVCSAVPSPNNNSQLPLRDLSRSLPFPVLLVQALVMTHVGTVQTERTQRFQSEAHIA